MFRKERPVDRLKIMLKSGENVFEAHTEDSAYFDRLIQLALEFMNRMPDKSVFLKGSQNEVDSDRSSRKNQKV